MGRVGEVLFVESARRKVPGRSRRGGLVDFDHLSGSRGGEGHGVEGERRRAQEEAGAGDDEEAGDVAGWE